jgi:hypothetical protein
LIVFVTVPHHGYTVDVLTAGGWPGQPRCVAMHYDRLWRSGRVPRATYILCDIERLTAHERRVAGELRAALLTAGLRCLNDPLRVPTRHGLLLRLHQAWINPFRAWRAEDRPQPDRFPVFLRSDAEHRQPIGDLIEDQAALDAAIEALPAQGFPPSGVLVVEFCGEPIAPGAWSRFGSFRIGDLISTDHCVIEDQWCVKYGTYGLGTEAMAEDEYRRVRDNVHAEALRPAFDLAGIEWGRADHATVGGREVIYEINTNPQVAELKPNRLKRRDETLHLSRARLIEGLVAIDTPEDAEPVPIRPGPLVMEWRQNSKGAGFPWRP